MVLRRSLLARFALATLFSLLAGCGGWTGAAFEGFSHAWRGGVDLAAAKLQPDLRYLLVDANGIRGLLVLGNVDPDPAGPVEVWYSADQAVLRLQGGRLVGIRGVGNDWVDVVLSGAPALSALAGTTTYQRTRTEMPDYRYRREAVTAAPLVAPPADVPVRWRDGRVAWVGEETAAAETRLPASYGLQEGRLVFGRQCLADGSCITWQPLPPGSLSVAGLDG